MIRPGGILTVPISAGRSSRGTPITGTVRLADFPGMELADGPRPTIVYKFGAPSVPASVRIRMPATPANYRVTLRAVDNYGRATYPVACDQRTEWPIFEVTDLRIGSPDAQGNRTVTATVHNSRNGVLDDLPWQFWTRNPSTGPYAPPQSIVRRGVLNVPPNGDAQVTLTLAARTLREGMMIGFDLDSANALREPEWLRTDNHASLRVRSLAVQDLDPARARAAGAVFSHNVDGQAFCNRLGVGDWQDRSWDSWEGTPRATGVLFMADCTATPAFPVVLPNSGGKADPEAYKDFTLKNGWVIRSAELVNVDRLNADFRWISPPKIGTSDPYIKAHLAADPGEMIKRGVRIVIEGPAGTNPYQ